MDTAFANAYGEQMTPNQMIQQLMHRVSELEKQVQWHNTHISELHTQLKEHNHENDQP